MGTRRPGVTAIFAITALVLRERARRPSMVDMLPGCSCARAVSTVPMDEATQAKFEELHYLETSIGKTGLRALKPMRHIFRQPEALAY